MEPIEVLTQEEKETIKDWIEHSCGSAPSVPIEYILREWNKEKEELFHLFGDKLKVSFAVERGERFTYFEQEREAFGHLPYYRTSKDSSNIVKERGFFKIYLSKMIKEYSFNRIPIFKMFKKLSNLFIAGEFTIDDYNRIARLTDAEVLFSNSYDGDSFTLTYSKKPGKKCQIPNGIKPLRALQKVFSFYHLSSDGYNEILERVQNFRDIVSYQKAACESSSEVILSIHPIDLLTISDNANGWSTCLSMENNGIYSFGITEVLNSNSLCVAYIRSDTNEFFDGRIDSKTFRSLVTITKDILAVGKSYPFHDTELDKALLSAISDRFNLEYEKNIVTYDAFYNEPFFEEDSSWIEDVSTNTPKDIFLGSSVPYIVTNNLFNDYIADVCYYSNWCSYNPQAESKFINVSGESMCLRCGKFEKYNIDIKTLACEECVAKKES